MPTFGFGPIASTIEYQNRLSKVVALVPVSGVDFVGRGWSGFVGRGYSIFGSGLVIGIGIGDWMWESGRVGETFRDGRDL